MEVDTSRQTLPANGLMAQTRSEDPNSLFAAPALAQEHAPGVSLSSPEIGTQSSDVSPNSYNNSAGVENLNVKPGSPPIVTRKERMQAASINSSKVVEQDVTLDGFLENGIQHEIAPAESTHNEEGRGKGQPSLSVNQGGAETSPPNSAAPSPPSSPSHEDAPTHNETENGIHDIPPVSTPTDETETAVVVEVKQTPETHEEAGITESTHTSDDTQSQTMAEPVEIETQTHQQKPAQHETDFNIKKDRPESIATNTPSDPPTPPTVDDSKPPDGSSSTATNENATEDTNPEPKLVPEPQTLGLSESEKGERESTAQTEPPSVESGGQQEADDVMGEEVQKGKQPLEQGRTDAIRTESADSKVIQSLGLHYVSKSEAEDNESPQKRLQLLELYKQGHREDYTYGDWEQPINDLAARVDRYGWISKTKLDLTRSYEETKRIAKQKEREEKWKYMTSDRNWPGFFGPKGPNKKLRERTYKGMPDSYRAVMWARFLGLPPETIEERSHKGGPPSAVKKNPEYVKWDQIYQGLKNRLGECKDLYQIDLDVNRALRDHIMFKDRYSIKQQHLFYVLGCFALHRPDMGYCQGMSGVVAFLLMFMDETTAFMAMDKLFSLSKYQMDGLYTIGFPRLWDMYAVFMMMVKDKLPDLKRHFERQKDIMHVDVGVFGSKWFLQVFQDKLPSYTVLRVWDIYLMEGYSIVPAVALAILQMHKNMLLRMDGDELMDFLSNRLPHTHIDTDQLLKQSMANANSIGDKGIKAYLDKYRKKHGNEKPDTTAWDTL
eukprot:comp20850_c0_seq1/m.27581 comp20850_c0_seq1/g.27581  ORF comp20850_c0_seq1/g.27581 comp20850_c0_seq1/m.27581 type:complete len:778 (-) comp20850_c0_seq1:31-2364(-)